MATCDKGLAIAMIIIMIIAHPHQNRHQAKDDFSIFFRILETCRLATCPFVGLSVCLSVCVRRSPLAVLIPLAVGQQLSLSASRLLLPRIRLLRNVQRYIIHTFHVAHFIAIATFRRDLRWLVLLPFFSLFFSSFLFLSGSLSACSCCSYTTTVVLVKPITHPGAKKHHCGQKLAS